MQTNVYKVVKPFTYDQGTISLRRIKLNRPIRGNYYKNHNYKSGDKWLDYDIDGLSKNTKKLLKLGYIKLNSIQKKEFSTSTGKPNYTNTFTASIK